ncbi:hypothetical protein LZC95_42540 [Pendulispora brunnea]|uniref:Uncharacterized protein n=1 Tax=Pendulispora brunnea TaxID=2905690 RepID=A0ABZ2K332_9BACT
MGPSSPYQPPGARSSDVPPTAQGPRRPWYLMTALVLAWIFGAMGFVQGCTTIVVLRGEGPTPEEHTEMIQSNEQRAQASRAAENYYSTMNNARSRYFPLAVAGMLLGVVMVGCAARCMSGREGARAPLIQLVTAQAALVLLAHFLAADVRQASLNFENAMTVARMRDSTQDQQTLESIVARLPRLLHMRDTGWLIVRSMLSGFIVIALTRSRSREFFEAANGRFSER